MKISGTALLAPNISSSIPSDSSQITLPPSSLPTLPTRNPLHPCDKYETQNDESEVRPRKLTYSKNDIMSRQWTFVPK